jgi:hypothetical protein
MTYVTRSENFRVRGRLLVLRSRAHQWPSTIVIVPESTTSGCQEPGLVRDDARSCIRSTACHCFQLIASRRYSENRAYRSGGGPGGNARAVNR